MGNDIGARAVSNSARNDIEETMTTPDEVAALVKRLRTFKLTGPEIDAIRDEAADALESLSPPAGMVMMRRARIEQYLKDVLATLDAVQAGAGSDDFRKELQEEITELETALSARERKE